LGQREVGGQLLHGEALALQQAEEVVDLLNLLFVALHDLDEGVYVDVLRDAWRVALDVVRY